MVTADTSNTSLSEAGVAPRLRSLRLAEEGDGTPESQTPTNTPPRTPPRRSLGHLSEKDGERLPLRVRTSMPSSGDGAASVSLRRSLLKSMSSGRTGKAALALQVLGVGCLVTAAFFAGRHFADSLPSPTTGTSTSVQHQAVQPAEQAADTRAHQSQQSQQTAQDLQANKHASKHSSKQSSKLAADAQSFLRGAAKAAKRGSTDAALSSNITEQHVKIFVAELPVKYNTDLLDAAIGLGASGSLTQATREAADQRQKEQAVKVAEMLANPFGTQLEDTEGSLWAGPLYNLDFMFHMQLLNSSLRTLNQSSADVVFVPFYIQKLVKIDKELEKPNRYALALTEFWGDMPGMLPYLGEKPHLLIVPSQEAELRAKCGGSGLDFLCNPLAGNFTILTPEMFTGNPSQGVSNRIAPGLIVDVKQNSSVVVIPSNANIHFSQSSQAAQEPFDRAKVRTQKTKVAAEAFRPRAPIRKVLKSQCLKRPDDCLHFEPQAVLQQTASSAALAIKRNNEDAWFCLQPPGDTAVRAALYECLLAGTLPVIFDPKLPQVLPFSDVVDWEALLTVLNAEDVMKKKEVPVDNLKANFSEADKLARLKGVHSLRHVFQYSLKSSHQLVRFDYLSLVTQHDDAFTMSLKAALKNLCDRGLLQGRCLESPAHKAWG